MEAGGAVGSGEGARRAAAAVRALRGADHRAQQPSAGAVVTRPEAGAGVDHAPVVGNQQLARFEHVRDGRVVERGSQGGQRGGRLSVVGVCGPLVDGVETDLGVARGPCEDTDRGQVRCGVSAVGDVGFHDETRLPQNLLYLVREVESARGRDERGCARLTAQAQQAEEVAPIVGERVLDVPLQKGVAASSVSALARASQSRVPGVVVAGVGCRSISVGKRLRTSSVLCIEPTLP